MPSEHGGSQDWGEPHGTEISEMGSKSSGPGNQVVVLGHPQSPPPASRGTEAALSGHPGAEANG